MIRCSQLLSRILAGSWRRNPPRPDISPDHLVAALPSLAGSGAAALAWRCLRGSSLEGSAAFEELGQAARLQILQAAIHERGVALAFRAARSKGAEPILLKGWAVARLYAEAWLRPAGDLDLLVRPDQRAAAEVALFSPSSIVLSVVDLKHKGFDELTPAEWEMLYERSELAVLEAVPVRVLGAEDQFRFLCEHLWNHSAYRPVWLCDVAATIESLPAEFDWDLCLRGGDRLTVNRVVSALGVAQTLLGAEVGEMPHELRQRAPPGWLLEEVLKQWEAPCTEHHLPRELMSISLRHPAKLLPALSARWPDPIRAYVGTDTAFDENRRISKQLKFFLSCAAQFVLNDLFTSAIPATASMRLSDESE